MIVLTIGPPYWSSPPMQQRDIVKPSQKTLSPPNITLAFLTLPKWRPQLAQEGTTASLCVHPPETNRANTALLVVAILFLRLGWMVIRMDYQSWTCKKKCQNAKKWHTRCARLCNDYNLDNNHYINTLWTHSEYTLNTLWTYSEHTLNILWRYAQDSTKSQKITHWLSNMDPRDASVSKNNTTLFYSLRGTLERLQ